MSHSLSLQPCTAGRPDSDALPGEGELQLFHTAAAVLVRESPGQGTHPLLSLVPLGGTCCHAPLGESSLAWAVSHHGLAVDGTGGVARAQPVVDAGSVKLKVGGVNRDYVR